MVHDKQFVIAKKAYIADGFQTVRLKEGYILSYQKRLKVYVAKGNKQGLLIGVAWQTDADKMAPEQELERLLEKKETIQHKDICEMEQSWCGRYVLIIEHTIYLDAAGLLGVFYAQTALSSSYSILCDVIGISNKYPNKSFGIGLGFQPGMLTMHNEIRRLLPSQIYDFINQSLAYRKLIPEWFECQQEKVMETLIQCFKNSLINMQQTVNGEIWLSLTGGHDSRTLMAFLESVNISYHCFTLEVDHISNGDRELPRLLAAQQKRKFLYIERDYKNFSLKRFQEYLLHSNGFAKDQDVKSYSFGQYQKLTENDENIVILRGGLWGMFIQHFRRYADHDGKLNIDQFRSRCPLLGIDELADSSISQYLAYIRKHKEVKISDANRYYWEVRSGCWLSSIEQSCDIMDHITFLQPCNSRRILLLLMRLAGEEEMPWKKYHEERIIKYCYPALLDLAFDKKYQGNTVHKSLMDRFYIKFFYNFTDILLYGSKSWIRKKGIYMSNRHMGRWYK